MRLMADVPDDPRARLLLLARVGIPSVLLIAFLLEMRLGEASMDHGLLIGAGILIARYFGKKGDHADEDAQGEHPATRFLFKAINEGDFEGAEDIVSEEFRAYANGYPLLADELDQGPQLIRAAFSYWRESLGDVRWELYDEAVQEQQDKSELLALRFVSAQIIADEPREIEIAAFARVKQGMLVEWRMVLDLTIFNEFRSAVGLPLLD